MLHFIFIFYLIFVKIERMNTFLPPAYAIEVMFSSCVCVCVCVSVCLSVWVITFQPVDIGTSFWCGGTS